MPTGDFSQMKKKQGEQCNAKISIFFVIYQNKEFHWESTVIPTDMWVVIGVCETIQMPVSQITLQSHNK